MVYLSKTLLTPQVLASDIFRTFWIRMKAMHSLRAASVKRYKPDRSLLSLPSVPSSAPRPESKSPTEGLSTSPSDVGSQSPPASFNRVSSTPASQDHCTLAHQSVKVEKRSMSPPIASITSEGSPTSDTSSSDSID